MARVLIVSYSRSGRTRRAAQLLARKLDADLDELTERANRRGARGYLSAGLAGVLGREAVLTGRRRDPSAYDLVVLATPVWSGSVSAPMRAYLRQYASLLPEVAFLVTCGGAGAEAAIGQLRALSNRDPETQAVLTDASFNRGDLEDELLDLAGRIQSHLRVRTELPVTPSDAAPPPGM